jgi:hypothetical protein
MFDHIGLTDSFPAEQRPVDKQLGCGDRESKKQRSRADSAA